MKIKYYEYWGDKGIIEFEISTDHPNFQRYDKDYVYIWCAEGDDCRIKSFHRDRETLRNELVASMESIKKQLDKSK